MLALSSRQKLPMLTVLCVACTLITSTVSCGNSGVEPVALPQTPIEMNLNDLTVNFSGLDRESILAEWHWLITDSNVPILITLAGDAFVQNTQSGAVSFLNAAEGSMTEVATDFESFQGKLGDKGFVMEHFCVSMIAPILAEEPDLGPHQVYSPKKPLVLGGKWEVNNLELTDLQVHFSILGQASRHVRDLPPGTPIGDITIK